MNCTICGLPIIVDVINEEEMAWCPKCGKDYTYEYNEATIEAESTRIEGEPSRNEISRDSRAEV